MKHVIIIPDGCADLPIDSLGGKTPMQAANIPQMDSIATRGIVGRSDNVPAHFPAGSEVANMTLFGYDPNQYFTGRAPIEAAAQGIQLAPEDFAVRCNLVTITDQIMVDFTADHISTEESTELLADLQATIGLEDFKFVPGVSYRNLLIYRGDAATPTPFAGTTRSRAPHDLTDLSVIDDYPRGPGSDLLCQFMQQSAELFAEHPVNKKRIAAGKRPATNVWLWGLGGAPALPSFDSLYAKSGAMITAVDLLRGLGKLVGWECIEVEGATGYLDTNYAGKGQAAIDALGSKDVVCVHVESTDEASHEGRTDEKIKGLEAIDTHIVGPVLKALQSYEAYRILVMPDHRTYCSTKKHEHGMVPFAVCGTDISADASDTYDEATSDASDIVFENGWELMPSFISGNFSPS
jgi:2,3-bisphosphoglycerate-independent phosphoglycerate mutase